MKINKILIGIGIAAAMAVSTSIFAIIQSSKHDISIAPYSFVFPAGQGPCSACHTPHGGTGDSPLWNHKITTVASFTVYADGNGTLDATVGQPTGVSKLCLSCHDGTVALENFGTTTTGTRFVATTANLGTNLSNDHPFSFTYDDALATLDGGLRTPSTYVASVNGCSSGGGHIDDCMLFNSKMECGSCHEVHNTTGEAKMLLKSNNGSALCTTCHIK